MFVVKYFVYLQNFQYFNVKNIPICVVCKNIFAEPEKWLEYRRDQVKILENVAGV